MGILESMVRVMGPKVSVSVGPDDPNVEPSYMPVVSRSNFGPDSLPACLQEVRKGIP